MLAKNFTKMFIVLFIFTLLSIPAPQHDAAANPQSLQVVNNANLAPRASPRAAIGDLAFDSGWRDIGIRPDPIIVSFDHNLGGDPDDYVVYLECQDNLTLGTYDCIKHNPIRIDASWFDLTSTSIKVWLNQLKPDGVRVRIYQATPAYDSNWHELGSRMGPITRSFLHRLRGNTDDYVVYLECRDAGPLGTYGCISQNPAKIHAHWFGLSRILIDVDIDSLIPDEIRVRIYKPTPDYDSGWHAFGSRPDFIQANFDHNLGGNPLNYLVYLECQAAGLGRYDCLDHLTRPPIIDAHWWLLSNTSITAYLGQLRPDSIRLRIFMDPPPFTPDFTGMPTSGVASLPVQFSDQSGGGLTGWAWYFGDEDFSSPWTFRTDNVWSARTGHTSVALPDGSILMMGGIDGVSRYNDVWRSTDLGANWTQFPTTTAIWSARSGHSSLALADGSILLMGGHDGSYKNDVFRSTDNGEKWWPRTSNAGWSGRTGHTTVALADGSILLMGGYDGSSWKNDIWRSIDQGANWSKVKDSVEWSARSGHTTVALPDASILLMGGSAGFPLVICKNDVWQSNDGGATWTLVTANADWAARSGHASLALPDGSILLMGGISFPFPGQQNDIWRSTDGGATWEQVTDSATWSARTGHATVVLRDGRIVLIGGVLEGNINSSDVWLLETAGSHEQFPLHTYVNPGFYQVSLQVYDSKYKDSIRKPDYIEVHTPIAPTIISPDNTTFTVGTAESFTVEATGLPDPAITSTGELPDGVTFTPGVNTASLAGTPAPGTAGTYIITITASNGVDPDAVQTFMLTVTEDKFEIFLPMLFR